MPHKKRADICPLLLALILVTNAGLASADCSINLQDAQKGIHSVMEDCKNRGTFSLGGMYDGAWQKLTYYYPEPWRGTFISVKVDGKVYTNSVLPREGERMDGYVTKPASLNGNNISMTWELPEKIKVEEILETIENYTLIHVNLVNKDAQTHVVGVRMHIDTMLGDNDGAPIYVPGDGLKRFEEEYSGPALNYRYWKAYNRIDKPNIVATGLLNGAETTYPDRLLITNWKKSSKTPWDYQTNKSMSILGDSAVILYYDPESLGGGESRSIVTGYGSGEPVLTKASEIVEILLDNMTAEYCNDQEIKIKVDVGSSADFEGLLEFNITDSAGETIYTRKVPVTIAEDAVDSIEFDLTTPENVSFEKYDAEASLYDSEGNLLDKKQTSFNVNSSKCEFIPPEEPEEINWTLMLILALIIIALIVLIVVGRKEEDYTEKIFVSKTKDGEMVTVEIKNESKITLENCLIEDGIPEGAEVDIATIHVRRKGTKLRLDVGSLEPGETATLEYKIKDVNVVPRVKFKWDGGEKASS